MYGSLDKTNYFSPAKPFSLPCQSASSFIALYLCMCVSNGVGECSRDTPCHSSRTVALLIFTVLSATALAAAAAVENDTAASPVNELLRSPTTDAVKERPLTSPRTSGSLQRDRDSAHIFLLLCFFQINPPQSTESEHKKSMEPYERENQPKKAR